MSSRPGDAAASAGHVRSRPADVVRKLPPPRPGSRRRMSSLAISAPDGWDAGATVEAVAGEAAVDAQGRMTSAAPIRLRAVIGPDYRLTELDGDLPAGVAGRLTGLPVTRGFRKELAALAEAGLAPGSPAAALLDDLPTVRLISGYARLLETGSASAGARPGSVPLLNICSGWAPEGTAHRLARSGQPPVTGTPEAPGFADMLAQPSDFLTEPALRPRSMRRRRILEVVPSGGRAEAYEYFRDSHVDGLGREGALHEYVVTAVLDTGDLVVREISVEPRSLPFPECPLASGNARTLAGTSLLDIDSSVRTGLSGTLGCTHLNDVLRFLRFAEPLLTP